MAECHDPECDCCKLGPEKLAEQEQVHMEKVGWYAHVVSSGDEQSPTGYNYHTHGFGETFDCPDMQIVCPLPPKKAHGIMRAIVNALRDGHRFTIGEITDKVLDGHNVTFVKADESGREVLRVILPDESGDVAQDSINEPYKDQWIGCKV